MNAPLISVLIDTYNHERYIEQAIVSVLEQDFPASDVEVLVVDDGSSDETPSIVQKFVPRVRYLRKENGGQASAFNAGIPQLRGGIVAFLDGDDWWAKRKLTAIAEAFQANPEIAAVGHGFYEVCDSDPPREMIVPANSCRFDLSSVDAARFADDLNHFHRFVICDAKPVEGLFLNAKASKPDIYLWAASVNQDHPDTHELQQ